MRLDPLSVRTARRMTLSQIRSPLLLLFALLFGAPFHAGHAQERDSTVSASAMETFVKAHIALTALRSQAQAELAATSAKKPDVQAAVREKLTVNSQRLLKEHGFTEAEFARLTRRVGTDDVVRKAFEETLARVSGGKGAG
jgi:hypothetical protein